MCKKQCIDKWEQMKGSRADGVVALVKWRSNCRFFCLTMFLWAQVCAWLCVYVFAIELWTVFQGSILAFAKISSKCNTMSYTLSFDPTNGSKKNENWNVCRVKNEVQFDYFIVQWLTNIWCMLSAIFFQPHALRIWWWDTVDCWKVISIAAMLSTYKVHLRASHRS